MPTELVIQCSAVIIVETFVSRAICYDIVAKRGIDGLVKRIGACWARRLLSLTVRPIGVQDRNVSKYCGTGNPFKYSQLQQ